MNLDCRDVRDLAAGYVLGALTADEEAAIRDHLATCPELHPELAELGGVVAALNRSLDPVEPPPALRSRLLAAAAAPAEPPMVDGSSGRPSPEPGSVVPFPIPGGEATLAARRGRVGPWVVAAAAVLAIAVLGAWNLQLQGQLSGAQRDLAAARAYQAGVAAVLDIGTHAGARTAFLAPGTGVRATGVAAAAPDGTIVVALRDLAPTSGSQVYEGWVIVGRQAPVAIGGITVGGDGTGVLRASTRLAAPGVVVAFTLEPAAGATTPTGPVVAAGPLQASAG